LANQSASLSIFIATRKRPAESFREGLATVKQLQEFYGYKGETSKKEAWVRTLDDSAPISVYHEVLSRRPNTVLPLHTEYVRGITLRYGCVPNVAPGTTARNQHYVADLLARKCHQLGESIRNSEPWKASFVGGFYQDLDANLAVLLESARALERNDLISAVTALDRYGWVDLGETSVARGILARLAYALGNELTGAEFEAISEGLEARSRKASSGLRDYDFQAMHPLNQEATPICRSCIECGCEFTATTGEIERLTLMFGTDVRLPKRCSKCRKKRRQTVPLHR